MVPYRTVEVTTIEGCLGNQCQQTVEFVFFFPLKRANNKRQMHGNGHSIGPLLSQRFPVASAKAQSRGGGGFGNSQVLKNGIGDIQEPFLCVSETQ